MAETAKTAKPAAAPAPPVAETPAPAPAPAVPKKENKFLKALTKLMTATTWFVLGLAFLFLAFLLHKVPGLIPEILKPVLHLYLPHLPYAIFGLGMCFLAHTRSIVLSDYNKAFKKNRQFPHAWKLPLIWTQVTILYLGGFYAMAISIGKAQVVTNLMGLIIILSFFLAYVLWYVIAHFVNRFPSVAGLRTALLALTLSALAHFSWTIFQFVLGSLFLSLFAIFTAVAAMAIAPKKVEEHGARSKLMCLVGSVLLLAWVAYNAIPFNKPQCDLVQLSLATNDLDLKGSLDSLVYSPNGKTIAFSQKTSEGWFLNIISSDKQDPYAFSGTADFRPGYSDSLTSSLKSFKIPAGGEAFRPIFAGNGKFLFVDAVKDGVRGIWKVDSEKGTVTVVKKGPVEPFANSLLWSPQNNELAFVTKQGAGYQLSAYSALTGKTRVLLTLTLPILTPAWSTSGKQIVYCDGTHGVPYLLNVASKKNLPLLSDEERVEGGKFQEGPPIQTVEPAPDGFRYLYVTQKDKKTALWSILADGTKRVKLYETTHAVSNVAWFSDGQKVVFQDHGYRCGFFTPSDNIQVMNANLYTSQSLILPQLSIHSPAISPDGVKVAFASGQGLWYPSLTNRKGIWIAVLR